MKRALSPMRAGCAPIMAWSFALCAALAALAAHPVGATEDPAAAANATVDADASSDALRGEFRLRHDSRATRHAGPLSAATSLSPGIAPVPRSASVAEAELRGTWHAPAVARTRTSLTGAAWLETERREQGGAHTTHSSARLNEGFVAGDFGAWQASAGKKIVAWDIGHGFRPNDLVQQEPRRTLLALAQEGRPLIELEHYAQQSAAALVWVNPHHANAAPDAQRGAAESALAVRGYLRDVGADWHAFGRWGRDTRASVGAALAWVATEELELHASTRILQRHTGWRIGPQAGTAPVAANPWQQATLGRSAQGLLGGSWTGAGQISLLAEWWYDGSALADREWDAWQARNRGLVAFASQSGLPRNLIEAGAGNLAWQATPFAADNLRRNNVFMRLAWQPARWVVSLDALLTPSDRGHVITAAAQWQGERLRVNAAWRVYGGPADALFAMLPQRSAAVLAAAWAF